MTQQGPADSAFSWIPRHDWQANLVQDPVRGLFALRGCSCPARSRTVRRQVHCQFRALAGCDVRNLRNRGFVVRRNAVTPCCTKQLSAICQLRN